MVISKRQSDFLNLIRWVAAWLVLAEHGRSLVFADFTNHGSSSAWIPFYFITGFGNQAVMVFFVISGYLVGGKVLANFGTSQFQWPRYFCDRLSRLYTVLIAALFLGLIFDFLGSRYLNNLGQYTNTPTIPIAVVTRDFSDAIQIDDLAANLCFLQNVVAPTFGSNGPLWSLSNEWWYYVLFPLALTLIRGSTWSHRGVAGLLLFALLSLLPKSLILLGTVWLIGVAASAFQNRILPLWLSAFLTVSALTVARLHLLQYALLSQIMIGTTFALFLNSMSGCSSRLPYHKLSGRLADFSYTLYLVHFPFILLAVSVIHASFGFGFKMVPGLAPLAIFTAVCIVAILFSWLVSIGTEQHTADVRRWGYRKLGISRPELSTMVPRLPVQPSR